MQVLKLGEGMKLRKKVISSLLACTFITTTLISTIVPTYAMTDGLTEDNSSYNQSGDIDNFDLNKEQQMQNLYLEKVKFDPKLLEGSKELDLILQFNVEPVQIQMLNQEKNNDLEKKGIFKNNKESTSEVTLEGAEKAVEENHSDFKLFVKNQTKDLKGAGESNPIAIGKEYTQVFNGLAVKMPSTALNNVVALPYVKNIYLNVKYDPIPASQTSDAPANVTGDGMILEEEVRPDLVGEVASNRNNTEVDSEKTETSSTSENSNSPLSRPVPPPGPEGPQSGETAVLDWLRIHDLQKENITGKGVKVGVLDTGIDYNHPDLAGVYQGGKDFIDNDDDPMETVYSDWLKAKEANDSLPSDQQNPKFPTDYRNYITSHGTHVAGTVAGQSLNSSPNALRGVAPEVELYAYRVLGPYGGSDEGIIGGIEESYKDGCQVINLSLGSNINDSLSATAISINNITDLGVTACIAAGNAGPNVATLGTPAAAAKAITVGAITHPKQVPLFSIGSYGVDGTDGAYPNVNSRLLQRNFSEADDELSSDSNSPTKYDIVDAGYGTPEWYDYLKRNNIDVKDKVVLVKRGAASMNMLIEYAAQEQVKAMILWNPDDNPNLVFDEEGYYPYYLGAAGSAVYTIQISRNDGQKFYDAVKNGTIKTISLSDNGKYSMDGDTLGEFSSTGPVTGSLAIKPDVVAPGVDIYSTAPYDIWEPDNSDYSSCYQTMSGTSMAAPHVTGMAALILQAHPNYKPEDVKVALMGTADPISTEKSLFQIGAGKTDPYQAVHTDMQFKVKDYIQTGSSAEGSSNSNTITELNTTGSFSFGYVPREVGGAIQKTGDLYVTNNGTVDRTFDISNVFFKDTYVKDGQDGAEQGAKISVSNLTSPEKALTSITVPAGDTVQLTVKFSAPDTAASGYYEAYINFVNSASSTETYRIPLALNVQSRGIDFRVQRKAITLSGKKNFNPNTYAVAPQSWAEIRVKSPIDPSYSVRIYLMDITGENYIGYINTLNAAALTLGELRYVPFLASGSYYPYRDPISKDDPNLTVKLTQQLSTIKVTEEGGYIVQARAIDGSTGELYEINDSVYVDNIAPTLEMDKGSEPGIYEIDPDGTVTEGALKWFSGKAYDSNVDYMLNVGKETEVPAPPSYATDTKVSQALGRIDGMYGDSNSAPYVNWFFKLNDDGTFKFGVSEDDIVNTIADPRKENYGTQFRIYPEDYSLAGNLETQGKYYYFVKKGNEYVVNRFERVDTPGSTTINGIDPDFLKDKTLVAKGDNFKSTLSVKYPKNLVGAKFYLDVLDFTEIKDFDFSEEYKEFLLSKGITADKSWIQRELDINGDFIYTFNLPEDVQAAGVLNTADTISDGVAQEMPLIDINYKVTNDAGLDTIWVQRSALIPEIITYNDGENGLDRVPIFQDKFIHIKGGANISGSIRPEGFQNYPTANVYGRSTPITEEESGVEIKFVDPNEGGITSEVPVAEDPTGSVSSNNPGLNKVGLFVTDLPMPAGSKPYDFTIKMPGHLTYYGTLTMNDSGQYGYSAGGNYSISIDPMLAGDVNGDDVIDMEDIQAECDAYNKFVAASSIYTREADFNFDGTIDYTDFEYIVKNFGKYNTTAPNAEDLDKTIVLTTSEDITLTGFGTLPKDSDLISFNTMVKPVPYIKSSDNNAFVYYGRVTAFQLFSVAYKNPDASTGASTITQIDDAAWRAAVAGDGGEILIDGVDRKMATNSYNGNTVNSIVDKVVSNKGQYEFDPSLFDISGVHTIVFKAPGYMDRSLKFKMQDGVGNNFSLLAPNNSNTINKPLTFSRTDTTGSTASHYRDMWMPNITSITVTNPSGNVVKTYSGDELKGIFNQITPANATTFNFTIPGEIFDTPSVVVGGMWRDWNIAIEADNYGTYSFKQRINAHPAPQLTAEANRYFDDDNINPISIAVTGANDTQGWRDAITAINVGSTTILREDFENMGITLGDPSTDIKFDKSLFTTPGSTTIKIIAANYQTATVAQPLFKQGTELTAPTDTVYAGKDIVVKFTPGKAASEWISEVKATGDIKFGNTSSPSIKTRVVIDETAGTITIPYDLVRTDGGASAYRSLIITASSYADNSINNIKVTAQAAPELTLSAPEGTPQYGDTITYTINGDDNPLWRSSILIGATSSTSMDNGDVTIQNTSVKPFVTTSVKDGVGAVTIDGNATQFNTAAGNKNIKFLSPYFAPITIAQPFVQRTAPTPTLTPSGVGKPVIITLPNNAENMRWANAAKAALGDIIVGTTSVKADTTISSDESNIILTLPGTAFTAAGNINITFKSYCYPDIELTQVVKNNPPEFASKVIYIQESTPITISYEQDSEWLAAAPIVSINGTVVDPSKYTLSDTELTFADRSLFQQLGDNKITISATGYMDTTFDIIVSDQLMHLVTVTSDSNGTINPKGSVPVLHGTNQKFEIKPNTGYEIDSLKLDGVEIEAVNDTFTLSNITQDHILDVTFKPIVYTVTFNSNGGSKVESITAEYSTPITEPTAPTREGYNFGGWYKDADCKSPWNFETDTVTADTTLYAKWTINNYTVNFDSQGGSPVDSINVEYNNKVTVLTAPTREGYTFDGWYKEAECTNPWNFETDTITADTTLYAKWTINSYTVNFDSQGGSHVDSINVEYNYMVTEPEAPTREGYTFGGWYKNAECSVTWDFGNDTIEADTTLYAKWTINSYIVNFDSQGGSRIDSVKVEYNNKATAPTAPTRKGYTFKGWYKDDECTIPWDFDVDKVTSDTILYAKWSANKPENGGTDESDKPDNGGDNGDNNSGGNNGSNLPQTGSMVGTTLLWIMGIILLASGCFIFFKKREKSTISKK